MRREERGFYCVVGAPSVDGRRHHMLSRRLDEQLGRVGFAACFITLGCVLMADASDHVRFGLVRFEMVLGW